MEEGGSNLDIKHTLRIAPGLLAMAIAVVISLGIAGSAVAGSAAELLEEGIYTEETVGDLEGAIEIYTRVVEKAEANRSHAAQAQFRLGICYLKKGSEAEARAAFDRLIQKFPEQEGLVALARERLAAVQPALALGLVPWEDGEFLEYQIRLPTGRVLGAMYLMAGSTVVDGVDAWQLELRRVVFTAADNYGVSRVLVDRHTQRPISSTFRHGMLGKADAVFGPDGVDITGGVTDTHLESEQEIYDNEQSMHLIRMLPLGPDYEGSISFLPTWTGAIVEVGLEVTGRETCKVPAGEFDCYAVQLDLGLPKGQAGGEMQTMWISTGPERYPVRLKAGGVIIELVGVERTTLGAQVPFSLEAFGLSGLLPAGWVPYEHSLPSGRNRGMVRLLDPDAVAISAIEVGRCPRKGCPSLQRTAERELSGAEERFDSFELREGSWTERTIAGHPAISFVADLQRNEKPWVQYRLYTFVNNLRLEIIFRTSAERFEGLRGALDSVVETLRVE